jgi:hypothetical protein
MEIARTARGLRASNIFCILAGTIYYIDSITRRECQESAKPTGCTPLVNDAVITGSTACRSKLNSCKHPRICFNLALVWVATLNNFADRSGSRPVRKLPEPIFQDTPSLAPTCIASPRFFIRCQRPKHVPKFAQITHTPF